MSVTGHQALFSHGKFQQQEPLFLGENKVSKKEILSTSSFTQLVNGTIFTDISANPFLPFELGQI